MQDITSWTAIVRDVGFPIAALAAVGLAIWWTLKWLGTNAVKPLVSSTVSLHATLQENDTKKTVELAGIARSLRDLLDHGEVTSRQVDEIHRVVVRKQE